MKNRSCRENVPSFLIRGRGFCLLDPPAPPPSNSGWNEPKKTLLVVEVGERVPDTEFLHIILVIVLWLFFVGCCPV